MIGFLKGEIIYQGVDHFIVDVNGVGYRVENFAPHKFGLEGDNIELNIHTHVREQEIRLFGFQSRAEMEIFDLLLNISGVGPKSAMILVSQLSVRQIYNAVKSNHPEQLKVKGIGKKTTAKIVIEMQGKLDKNQVIASHIAGGTATEVANANTSDQVALDVAAYQSDLVEALQALGYREPDFEKYLTEIDYRKSFSEQMKEMLSYIA